MPAETVTLDWAWILNRRPHSIEGVHLRRVKSLPVPLSEQSLESLSEEAIGQKWGEALRANHLKGSSGDPLLLLYPQGK